MAKKIWYEIYGEGPFIGYTLLAKVRSEGLANIVANELSKYYKNVTVK